MIACLDVHYRDQGAKAAGLIFREWADDRATAERVVAIERVEEYRPGEFYRRELPCLLAVLAGFDARPEVVLVDGYVWLGPGEEPGLGARLHEALGGDLAVIGVAKTRFATATRAIEVRRGASRSPLHVTAIGIDPTEAAARIVAMHGPYRIPTLLKRVDRLGRD